MKKSSFSSPYPDHLRHFNNFGRLFNSNSQIVQDG